MVVACSVGLVMLHMVELCAILTVVFLGGEPAMRVVTLEEARGQLNDLLALVLQGEKVFIRTEQGMVQLTAMPAVRPRQFGSARGVVTLGEDFEAPLEDFLPYLS